MKNLIAKCEKISELFAPNSWWWPAVAFLILTSIAIYFIVNGRPWYIWILLFIGALWALYALWTGYRICREKQKDRRKSGGQEK